MRLVALVLLTTTPLVASVAHAEVILQAQQRTISALSTAGGAPATAAASSFAPFIDAVTASAPFQTAQGTTALSEATTTINCLADPNAIRATGQLLASGGQTPTGGSLTSILGESHAFVQIDFDVLTPTPFSLTCAPRPGQRPTDIFELSLRRLHGGGEVFSLTQAAPPQQVNLSGILQPGSYRIKFDVELTWDGAPVQADYGFALVVPSPSTVPLAALALLGTRRRRR